MPSVDQKYVPTTFKWSQTWGNHVCIAGSFDPPTPTWTPIEMPMNKDNVHEVSLDLLPDKKYYFKFVIDGNWVLDQSFPSCPDSSGNWNHEIQVELPPPPPPVEEIKKEVVADEQLQQEEVVFEEVINEHQIEQHQEIQIINEDHKEHHHQDHQVVTEDHKIEEQQHHQEDKEEHQLDHQIVAEDHCVDEVKQEQVMGEDKEQHKEDHQEDHQEEQVVNEDKEDHHHHHQEEHQVVEELHQHHHEDDQKEEHQEENQVVEELHQHHHEDDQKKQEHQEEHQVVEELHQHHHEDDQKEQEHHQEEHQVMEELQHHHEEQEHHQEEHQVMEELQHHHEEQEHHQEEHQVMEELHQHHHEDDQKEQEHHQEEHQVMEELQHHHEDDQKEQEHHQEEHQVMEELHQHHHEDNQKEQQQHHQEEYQVVEELHQHHHEDDQKEQHNEDQTENTIEQSRVVTETIETETIINETMVEKSELPSIEETIIESDNEKLPVEHVANNIDDAIIEGTHDESMTAKPNENMHTPQNDTEPINVSISPVVIDENVEGQNIEQSEDLVNEFKVTEETSSTAGEKYETVVSSTMETEIRIENSSFSTDKINEGKIHEPEHETIIDENEEDYDNYENENEGAEDSENIIGIAFEENLPEETLKEVLLNNTWAKDESLEDTIPSSWTESHESQSVIWPDDTNLEWSDINKEETAETVTRVTEITSNDEVLSCEISLTEETITEQVMEMISESHIEHKVPTSEVEESVADEPSFAQYEKPESSATADLSSIPTTVVAAPVIEQHSHLDEEISRKIISISPSTSSPGESTRNADIYTHNITVATNMPPTKEIHKKPVVEITSRGILHKDSKIVFQHDEEEEKVDLNDIAYLVTSVATTFTLGIISMLYSSVFGTKNQ